jgi:hypothetical protein
MRGSTTKDNILNIFKYRLTEIYEIATSENSTETERQIYSKVYDEILLLRQELFRPKFNIQTTMNRDYIMSDLHELNCKITNYIIKNKELEDQENIKELEELKQNIRNLMLSREKER